MKKMIAAFMILLLGVCSSVALGEPVIQEFPYTKTTTLAYPKDYTMRFSLWDAVSEGAEVWWEEKPISLTSSKIKTNLGDTISLGDVDFSQQLWVQVELRRKGRTYKVLGGRDRLSVVPYALWSGDRAPGGEHNHDGIYVGIGEPNSIATGMIVDGTVSAADVGFNFAGSPSKGGAASTALALGANGTNCPPGQFPLGVDAAGNAESCTTAGALSEIVSGAGLTGGGDSGAVVLNVGEGTGIRVHADTVEVLFTLSGGENGVAATVARGDHLHNAAYVGVNGDTMTGELSLPSIDVPQIRTGSPGQNLSISAADGAEDGESGAGGNVIIRSGETRSWSAPPSSHSKVTLQGGSMEGANSGAFIDVEGGYSVSGGSSNSVGGAILISGGNASGKSYSGGNIVLAGGSGSPGGGVIITTNGSRPVCSAVTRGMIWFYQGGEGVKDSIEACAKDEFDGYDWRVLW